MKAQVTTIIPFNDGDFVHQNSRNEPMIRVQRELLGNGSSFFNQSGVGESGLIILKEGDDDLINDLIDSLGSEPDATEFIHLYSSAAKRGKMNMFVYTEHLVQADQPETGGWQQLMSKYEGSADLYAVTVKGVSVWKRSVAAAHRVDSAGDCEFTPFIVKREDRDPEPERVVATSAKAGQSKAGVKAEPPKRK